MEKSNSFRSQVALKVPVVVRLEGTNVDQGKRILKVYFHLVNFSWGLKI